MKNLVYFLILSLLFFSCDRNHSPVISNLISNPPTTSAGTLFTLTVIASDEDGDVLNYLWTAGEGSFTTSTNTKEVKWKSPATGAGKTFTITVVVSDGKIEITREIQILLGEPELGSLAGQVNFTNFKIPISAVTVKVGDKTSTTDENGHFSISGIPAVDDSLIAAKQDFTTYKSAVKIIANDTLKVTIEMTSINFTTKAYGIISDQDGAPQEFAHVLILNPDGSESKLKTTTNAAGYYRLWYIPRGVRTIIVRKASNDDVGYVELIENIDFQEVEFQLDLVIKKLSLRGEFTDPRDNHLYRYKTIGNVTWMTENLAYLPKVSPSANGSENETFCYVYGYQGTDTSTAKATDNYKQYGVLYNLPAARAVCPAGWHLSTIEEWNVLINALGTLPGEQMKSTSGWANHGNGTNSSGFSALPGGIISERGGFSGLGEVAYFPTSSYFSIIPEYGPLRHCHPDRICLFLRIESHWMDPAGSKQPELADHQYICLYPGYRQLNPQKEIPE